jgi:hypothetical protein
VSLFAGSTVKSEAIKSLADPEKRSSMFLPAALSRLTLPVCQL